MAGDLTDPGASYSQLVGFIFVFNLIVGTGALTMPAAFSSAGWLLSLITIGILGVMSYMTVTFVIESMAAGNALIQWKRSMPTNYSKSDSINYVDHIPNDQEETQPLLSASNVIDGIDDDNMEHFYVIKERIEMGRMASMFFNKVGLNLFYIGLCIYLYGDVAIYAAAISKSLRDVVCTWHGINKTNITQHGALKDDDYCWNESITRINAYRLFVAVETLILGPFVFFNVQKTKYLQLLTTVLRWFAFAVMIALSVMRLTDGKGKGDKGDPGVVNFNGFPNLFGILIYSFMCHHSLPSLVTPIKNKSKIYSLFALDYFLIMGFYCLLSFTGIFTFSDLKDIYTLNFEYDPNDPSPITKIQFFQYFLALFPVIVLSSNFPIICITLRNNIKSLFYREDRPFHWVVDRIVFPVAAVVPPIVAAIATSNITMLVSITGSYAGAAVQYIIPAFLVYCARKKCESVIGGNVINKHRSPFKHNLWVMFVLLWAAVCIILVTVNHIISNSL